MASRTLVSPALALIFFVTACKFPEASSPNTPAPASDAEASATTTTGDARASAPSETSAAAPPSDAAEAGVSPTPSAAPAAPPAENERPGPPLPELRVKSFGLHVGGSRDDDLRKEVQRTLERGFPRYLDCYRLIDAPGSEGTFGADLRVPVEGGTAKVEQPRTKLPGEAFRACMIKAFESARFEPPSSGRTTVVSYSVKFSFGW
jgi:hypothetical protein